MSLQAELLREMAWQLDGANRDAQMTRDAQWLAFHRQNPKVPQVYLHDRADVIEPVVRGRALVGGTVVACLPAHVRERAHALHASHRRLAAVCIARAARISDLMTQARQLERAERGGRRRPPTLST